LQNYSLDELKRKMAAEKMRKALEASQEAAKKCGIDKWTMDINDLIKEVREEHKKSNEENSD